MGIVLFSENGSSNIASGLGDNGEPVARYPLEDAFRVPSLMYCDADVVLLDCGTDVESGLRALRDLKTKCPGTPVIFVTDHSSEDAAITAFRSGARDYFRKPINLALLRDTVTRLASVRRTARERRVPLQTGIFPGVNGAGQHKPPEAVLRALGVLEERFTEELSLDDISGVARMSKFHFTRLFKRHTGLSPVQFRTHLRIERAKRLLSDTRLPVARIAADVGFNDISNFIRHFKKTSGLTPQRYRMRTRKSNA